tara:strand:+ start:195 stop:926 length:732 start_codon:yes stop_codon:yes gene_type:complete
LLRGFWVLFNVSIWTTILGTVGALASLFEAKRGRTMGHCARIWANVILITSGIPYKIYGLKHLDPANQYIFAGNHGSGFDIPLAFAALPYWLVPVAKIELRKVPVLGWVMNAGGHIFVDRSSHEKAISSMMKARDSLIKTPRSVMLWPEGSRTKDGTIAPFKRGGLLISIETGMPVVPVAFVNSYKLHKKGSWRVNKIAVEIRIGKPIPVDNYTKETRRDFANNVRDAVVRLHGSPVPGNCVG